VSQAGYGPAPTSRNFWLLLQNDLVHWQLKTLYSFYNSLAPQIFLVNKNPNLRHWLHHLEIFGSGSSHPKLFGLRLHSPAFDPSHNSCIIHDITTAAYPAKSRHCCRSFFAFSFISTAPFSLLSTKNLLLAHYNSYLTIHMMAAVVAARCVFDFVSLCCYSLDSYACCRLACILTIFFIVPGWSALTFGKKCFKSLLS